MHKYKRRKLNIYGKLLAVILCIILAVSFPMSVYAKEASANSIEIQRIDGEANIINKKAKTIPAKKGVKLNSGESIQTDAKSYVYLSLDENKVVKVDELSQVNIKKSGKKLTIEVEEGAIFFEVKEKLKEDESMDLGASTMAMSIRGTAGIIKIRRVEDKIVTDVGLLDGRVDMLYADVKGDNHDFTLWGGEEILHPEGSTYLARDLIDITELEGFAAIELKDNPKLSETILKKSGLNSAYAIEHAKELLAKDQKYNEEHYSDVFVEGNTSSVASLKMSDLTQNRNMAKNPEPVPEAMSTPEIISLASKKTVPANVVNTPLKLNTVLTFEIPAKDNPVPTVRPDNTDKTPTTTVNNGQNNQVPTPVLAVAPISIPMYITPVVPPTPEPIYYDNGSGDSGNSNNNENQENEDDWEDTTDEPVPTNQPVVTPVPVSTATPEPAQTATPAPVETATPTPSATLTPTATAKATATPEATATPTPTNAPTATPTETPFPENIHSVTFVLQIPGAQGDVRKTVDVEDGGDVTADAKTVADQFTNMSGIYVWGEFDCEPDELKNITSDKTFYYVGYTTNKTYRISFMQYKDGDYVEYYGRDCDAGADVTYYYNKYSEELGILGYKETGSDTYGSELTSISADMIYYFRII